jgi:hypothetical protein
MGSMNWDEVERSAKEGQRQRGGGGRLYLEDGDTADLRIISKELYIYKRHFDAKTSKYIVCAEDYVKAGDHEGCVACAIAKTLRGKTARLKSPQRLYAISVFDPRKFHYVESKPKDEQYQDCTDDDSCRYCRRNVERKIRGVRHWSLAENLALQLRTFERDTLGKKCRKCGTGKIKVKGYQCPVCESDMEPDEPGERQRCIPCEKELGKRPVERVAKEVITCTNCGPKGRRLTLADAWISVTKSGKRQNTTWNFTVGDIEPFDPEPFLKEFKDLKIEPIDFTTHPDFLPLSAAEQALLLDVDNPFAKGRKRASNDDEDDEDDGDEKPTVKFRNKKKKSSDDEDDDDDPPRKKKKRDDDEDEDEDDDENDKIFD